MLHYAWLCIFVYKIQKIDHLCDFDIINLHKIIILYQHHHLPVPHEAEVIILIGNIFVIKLVMYFGNIFVIKLVMYFGNMFVM